MPGEKNLLNPGGWVFIVWVYRSLFGYIGGNIFVIYYYEHLNMSIFNSVF